MSFPISIRRLLLLLFYAASLPAQQRNPREISVAFWNVENLYDTLDDKLKDDDEFTPAGKNRWNTERYKTKLLHLAEVIQKLGPATSPPSIIGLCEIENSSVLRDLVQTGPLAALHYTFAHAEGPDVRGVDPALLYDPTVFHLTALRSFPVLLADSHKTRDILLVSGLIDSQEVSVLVNHWPSRRGGELASRMNRMAAAHQLKKICDSLSALPVAPAIIVMGDFNDDPSDESVKYLGTTVNEHSTGNLFFNPMEKLQKQGAGSLAYRDAWNLFDQIMFRDLARWRCNDAQVYSRSFLRHDYGNYKGYPFRTYSGNVYTGGYSDHFPVYAVLSRQ